MDDRLAKALDHAHYKATVTTARKNLLLRYQNALLHSCNGGVFTITRELILYVESQVRSGLLDMILIDDKQNPIMIATPSVFLQDIEATYHEATNRYFTDFENLRKARNVKTVVGL